MVWEGLTEEFIQLRGRRTLGGFGQRWFAFWRLLVRELQRGKLAGFIGIGGGFKTFRAEQSLIGKEFTQVWM